MPRGLAASLTLLAATAAAILVLVFIIEPTSSTSRREDAMSSLLRAQILQQRWHSSHGRYGSVSDIWPLAGSQSTGGYYILSDALEVLPSGPNVDAYAIKATPKRRQNGSPCGTFVITSKGPLLQPPWAGPDCWAR